MNVQWRYLIGGVMILVIGLLTMWWGAYASCRDGGGEMRGFPPYLQCVSPNDACTVPFLDGISMQGCKDICTKSGGVVIDQRRINYSGLINLSSFDGLN